MWGTPSPDDKLTGDLGNVIEATESGDRQLIRVTAEKLSPDNFRLLQQYPPGSDICTAAKSMLIRSPRSSVGGTSRPSALAVSAGCAVIPVCLRVASPRSLDPDLRD